MAGRIIFLGLAFFQFSSITGQRPSVPNIGIDQILIVEEVPKGSASSRNVTSRDIIDINSSLEIRINRNALQQHILGETQISDEVKEDLEDLKYILANETELLEALNKKIQEASDAQQLDALANYSQLMLQFYTRIKEHPRLRERAVSLFTEYFERPGLVDRTVFPTAQAYVVRSFVDEIDRIASQVKSEVDITKYTIQMTAHLRTQSDISRKVHIENFDLYSDGEFYNVDRWVTSFTPQDMVTFESARNMAGVLNDKLNDDFSSLKDLLFANINTTNCIEGVTTEIHRLVEVIRANIEIDLDEVLKKLQEDQSKLGDISRLISLLRDFDLTSGEENVLHGYNSLYDQIQGILEGEPLTIDATLTSLSEHEPIFSELRMDEVRTQVSECIKEIEEDILDIKHTIEIIGNIFVPIKKSTIAAEEMSSEVLRFSIADLPESGYIELERTGKPENGATLSIRLMKLRTDGQNQTQQYETVDIINVTLQQVPIHSISKVTMILANPYNQSGAVMLENDFQFAPAGSLLFKIGSRKSHFWNYLYPGVGINMSSTDMDLDGTPDVGVGTILSLLKDVLSAGVSFNTKVDSPFWFVGLSLPFSTPGLPINQVNKDRD